MTWDQASKEMTDNVAKIVAQTAISFTADIKKAWPVDTGFSRRAWQNNKITDFKYEVSNDVKYSPILWVGRRFYGDKWQGSIQMPLGGKPIFDKHERLLQEKLRKVTQ